MPVITVKPDELPPGAETKNRYANVIPMPETRVVLNSRGSGHQNSDYINANYVKVRGCSLTVNVVRTEMKKFNFEKTLSGDNVEKITRCPRAKNKNVLCMSILKLFRKHIFK